MRGLWVHARKGEAEARREGSGCRSKRTPCAGAPCHSGGLLTSLHQQLFVITWRRQSQGALDLSRVADRGVAAVLRRQLY